MKEATTGGRKRRKDELADQMEHARVTPSEMSEWRAKAEAAGVSLSELLRQSMGRKQTWTAAPASLERERTRELVRIANNLNQIARWANTYKRGSEAVSVVAHLAVECLLDEKNSVGKARTG